MIARRPSFVSFILVVCISLPVCPLVFRADGGCSVVHKRYCCWYRTHTHTHNYHTIPLCCCCCAVQNIFRAAQLIVCSWMRTVTYCADISHNPPTREPAKLLRCTSILLYCCAILPCIAVCTAVLMYCRTDVGTAFLLYVLLCTAVVLLH